MIPPLKFLAKSRIFQRTPKILKFSSLTPSYLLKIPKFIVKTCQFAFLVMTEKNIFVYKRFLSLNISDFNLFFMRKLNTPLPMKKVTLLFPSNPSITVEVLSSPPFLKI